METFLCGRTKYGSTVINVLALLAMHQIFDEMESAKYIVMGLLKALLGNGSVNTLAATNTQQ
jgi:hypothetical protein